LSFVPNTIPNIGPLSMSPSPRPQEANPETGLLSPPIVNDHYGIFLKISFRISSSPSEGARQGHLQGRHPPVMEAGPKNF
jgi:hypothetical protein